MKDFEINRLEILSLKAKRQKISHIEKTELNKLHKIHMKSIAPSWVLDTAKAIVIEEYRRDEASLGII